MCRMYMWGFLKDLKSPWVSMLNDAQRCSRVIHGMMTWGTHEATGEHLKEAIEINRSLTALGDVIEADPMGKRWFPHGFHGFKQQNRSGVVKWWMVSSNKCQMWKIIIKTVGFWSALSWDMETMGIETTWEYDLGAHQGIAIDIIDFRTYTVELCADEKSFPLSGALLQEPKETNGFIWRVSKWNQWSCLAFFQAVAERKRQVPYRNHKLTQLLQDDWSGWGRRGIQRTKSPVDHWKVGTGWNMLDKLAEPKMVGAGWTCSWNLILGHTGY